MKYLVLTLALILAGCTSSNDDSRQLKADLRETQMNLQSCQSRLEMYTSTGSGSSSTQEVESEPEKPAEPEYEDVDVYIVDGTKCYASENQGEAPACGRGFWKCNDGKIRECMVNVKYEIKTEKKLVEQE